MMTTFAKDDDDKKDDEKEGSGARAGELFFKSRTVLVTGEINDKLASRVTTQLIALAEDSEDPINLFISSPGGHVESGDMVHDMIKFIKPT
ncbi:MAG: ATP-dependent Clp protease proteolytic subunit, partial [Pseudomonadota bacterium]